MIFFHSVAMWSNDPSMNLTTSSHPENVCCFVLDSADRFYHFFRSARDYPLFIYLVTISFQKHFDPSLQTVRDILSAVEMTDRDASLLLRKEPYSDGEGYHVHVLVLMSRSMNFRETRYMMYQRGEAQFVVHLEKVRTTVENFNEVVRYIFKNDTRPETIRIIENTKKMMNSVFSLWGNFPK